MALSFWMCACGLRRCRAGRPAVMFGLEFGPPQKQAVMSGTRCFFFFFFSLSHGNNRQMHAWPLDNTPSTYCTNKQVSRVESRLLTHKNLLAPRRIVSYHMATACMPHWRISQNGRTSCRLPCWQAHLRAPGPERERERERERQAGHAPLMIPICRPRHHRAPARDASSHPMKRPRGPDGPAVPSAGLPPPSPYVPRRLHASCTGSRTAPGRGTAPLPIVTRSPPGPSLVPACACAYRWLSGGWWRALTRLRLAYLVCLPVSPLHEYST